MLLSEMRQKQKKFATDVAQTLKKGDVIALVGDLGTGKTTLSKYIAEALGINRNYYEPYVYNSPGISQR